MLVIVGRVFQGRGVPVGRNFGFFDLRVGGDLFGNKILSYVYKSQKKGGRSRPGGRIELSVVGIGALRCPQVQPAIDR